jgi:hypothetical protein
MNESEIRLAPTMKPALPVIRQIFKQYAPPGFLLEFTAGKEWYHHSFWSLHHSGNAVDVRTRTLPDRGVGTISTLIGHHLQEALNTRLGARKYLVLVNDAGPNCPHIHVQFNKGTRMSEPGDFKERPPNPVV